MGMNRRQNQASLRVVLGLGGALLSAIVWMPCLVAQEAGTIDQQETETVRFGIITADIHSRVGAGRSEKQVSSFLAAEGKVVACFSGHKHDNRWTVYGNTHYISLAATHRDGSFAKVTLGDKLRIEGVGYQRSYDLELRR